MDNWYQTPYNQRQASGSTENFQDTSTRLINNETDLNSAQQGYIKAINKIVRSTESLSTLKATKQCNWERVPPRALIPKLTPKIPDTPALFIIREASIQQSTAIELTET